MGSVVVSGPWMRAIWSEVPVHLPIEPDLPAFLDQRPMPPLLDDEGYKRSTADDTNRVMEWIMALLHHPEESVVLEVIRYWELNWSRYVETEVRMPYRTLLFDSAADHLLSDNDELAAAAARLFWRGYSEENWEQVAAIFADPAFPDEQKGWARLEQHRPGDPEGAVVQPSYDLAQAALAGRADIVRQLVEEGVDIESAGDSGETALMWAAFKGEQELAAYLLAKGANVEARSTTGVTPLMWAVLGGSVEVVELLLEHGADVSAQDALGTDAVALARSRGQTGALRALTAAASRQPVR